MNLGIIKNQFLKRNAFVRCVMTLNSKLNWKNTKNPIKILKEDKREKLRRIQTNFISNHSRFPVYRNRIVNVETYKNMYYNLSHEFWIFFFCLLAFILKFYRHNLYVELKRKKTFFQLRPSSLSITLLSLHIQ
jgi:hypothetical protein